MAFDIAINSDLPTTFYPPAEFADLSGDSPVVDFSRPRAKFRVTGSQVFTVKLADDLAFTQNVQVLGDHVLSIPAEPSMIAYVYAMRGPQRYGRITVTGSGGVYDARLEWSGS